MAPTHRTLPGLILLAAALLPASPAARAGGSVEETTIEVIRDAVVWWDKENPGPRDEHGFVARFESQTAERTVDLPPGPDSPLEARRVVARVRVEPRRSLVEGRLRPNDPWTRLGAVYVDGTRNGTGAPIEVELMRFITGFGAPGVFEQDVTALGPLLTGRRTLRIFLSTYGELPGWSVSLTLHYSRTGAGERRPALAEPVFSEPHLTAQAPRRQAVVTIPNGLDRPRLRVVATGHATDGLAGNEFVSCTHVLRVDGREIARWRPWSEDGGAVRGLNPWAGRTEIDGRELRSSDFDRSGWVPGLAVDPLLIPAPELTPGRHEVELEVLGIRPHDPPGEDGKEHHGYWVESLVVVADAAWPENERD